MLTICHPCQSDTGVRKDLQASILAWLYFDKLDIISHCIYKLRNYKCWRLTLSFILLVLDLFQCWHFSLSSIWQIYSCLYEKFNTPIHIFPLFSQSNFTISSHVQSCTGLAVLYQSWMSVNVSFGIYGGKKRHIMDNVGL